MSRGLTKRELAEAMYKSGRTIPEIASTLKVLETQVRVWFDQEATPFSPFDLNVYAKMFNGILQFKTLCDAEEAIQKMEGLHTHFEEAGDLRGIHQTQIMALMGVNRAEYLNRPVIAAAYRVFLISILCAPKGKPE